MKAPSLAPDIGDMEMAVVVGFENRGDFPAKGKKKPPVATQNGIRFRRGPGSSWDIRDWRTARPAVVRDGKVYLLDRTGYPGPRMILGPTGMWA